MNFTVKELADELGVSKQRVYRFIQRNHITEAHQEGQVKWYDEAAQSLVRAAFCVETKSDDASQTYINETLLMQIKIKDAQIAALNEALKSTTMALEKTSATLDRTFDALASAQALHAGDIKLQLSGTNVADAEPEPEPRRRRSWWPKRKR